MSTVGFTASAFCLTPLGTAGGFAVVASVATVEAMRESMGDGGDVVSFFCCLEVEAAALASAPSLFLEDAPSWVFTILRLSQREKVIEKRRGLRLERQR